MKIGLETFEGPAEIDLDRLAGVLQPAAHVPYAPPHVFPMSVPRFTSVPETERPGVGTKPLCIYVHIPFCEYACNFCFYVKHIGVDRATMARYVRALQREFMAIPDGTPIHQAFLGGGTPTALPADLLSEVLESMFDRVSRTNESVHTVECSPETITSEHISVFQSHGIGRASMGIQALDDDLLGRVNRRHTARKALEAVAQLVASGLMVNVDLIYGLPGQTKERFREDFQTLAALGVHCVNAYNLRVNEHTPVLSLLKEEERLELAQLIEWRALVQRTALELGYEQTHWQRFMLPNTNYELDLTSDNLYGAGVSARSFLDHSVYRNNATLGQYLERMEGDISPVEEVFVLDDEHRKTYFVTRTLGSAKPLFREEYQQEFGCTVDDDYGSIIETLEEHGLIKTNDDCITLTNIGSLTYDLVTLAFYPRYLQEWLEQRHAQALARRLKN